MKSMIVAWVATLGLLTAVVVWANGKFDTAEAEKLSATMAEQAEVAAVTQTEAEPEAPAVEAPSEMVADIAAIVDSASLESTIADDGDCLELAGDPAANSDSKDLYESAPRLSVPPWQQFAAPVTLDPNRTYIAIVMTDMGNNRSRSQNAIDRLPAGITFAFSPYAPNVARWSDIATDDGHEFLVMLPMEPTRYPSIDPGELGMLVDAPEGQNSARLTDVLAAMPGTIGLVSQMGSRFTAEEDALRPVLSQIQTAGLVFVDSRSTAKSQGRRIASELGMPFAINNRYIDNIRQEEAMLKQLAALEATAAKRGSALGIAQLSTLSVDTLAAWAETLDAKGFQLVPVSAIVMQ